MTRWTAVLVALTAGAAPARGASLYDPALTWRTITTPRFAVHYHEGERNLAVRTGRIAEDVLDQVSELFGYEPDGVIDVVLVDDSDQANGSAQVMPRNTLRLFVAAPTELTGLSSYDDWLRILVIHELAHLCDLDQTWGVTRGLRWLFGKYVSMNAYTPQFLSEGVAVYAETLLTTTGRGRSTYVDMLLRTAALEGRLLDIDQANVQLSDWPGGNAAYFYGGMFHLWLANRFGRDKVRALHQAYAATPVPYLYWPGAVAVFGQSLPALWTEWRHEVEAEARAVAAKVEAEGVTPSRRITFHGRNLSGARYSPDGSYILYSRTSPVDGSTVRRVDRDGRNDRRLVLDTFSPRFSFSPDGKSFYYSQAAVNDRFDDYDDLYRYDLERGRAVRLRERGHPGRSLRARDPDVSPDGKRIAFVQNALGQSFVSVGEIGGEDGDELDVRVLVPPSGDSQQASPRFSPDGRLLALSTWSEGGYRDIVVVDATSGALVRRITRDRALDGNPAWSPDGRWLLYESDADGISNVYAVELATGRYFRVTRVVGGAFQPDVARDGRTMLFRDASAIGFDIHEMPFDPARWEPLSYDPESGYGEHPGLEASVAPPGAVAARDGAGETGSELTSDTAAPDEPGAPALDGAASAAGAPSGAPSAAASPRDWSREPLPPALPRADEPPLELQLGEHDRPYSPWPSLLPFHDNWVLIPAAFFLNGNPSLTLTTFGRDALDRHAYLVSAGSSLGTRRLDWTVAYTNDVWYPTLTLAAGDLNKLYPGDARARERVVTAGAVLPLRQRHVLAVSWVRRSLTGLDADAAETVRLGDAAYLEAGYRYRLTRAFPYSVSEEHGGSLAAAVRWYDRALGGDYDELMLTVDGRAYVNNPLLDNHVLALRLAGAFALGPDFGQRFYLGGAEGASVLSVQTDEFYPLRGFPVEYSATSLAALYAEYRFPLLQVQRGLWTLPVFVERVHAAVFADSAAGFDSDEPRTWSEWARVGREALSHPMVGVGGELRADVSVGWAFPLTLRAGAGWPLVVRGTLAHRPRAQLYFALGSAL